MFQQAQDILVASVSKHIFSKTGDHLIFWGALLKTEKQSISILNGIGEAAPYHSPKDFLVDDDVIKWKHFPLYWPFVRGIHLSLVNSSYKG